MLSAGDPFTNPCLPLPASVLDRSPSQMSFLDQFLKEPPLRRAAGGGGSGSVASEDVAILMWVPAGHRLRSIQAVDAVSQG